MDHIRARAQAACGRRPSQKVHSREALLHSPNCINCRGVSFLENREASDPVSLRPVQQPTRLTCRRRVAWYVQQTCTRQRAGSQFEATRPVQRWSYLESIAPADGEGIDVPMRSLLCVAVAATLVVAPTALLAAAPASADCGDPGQSACAGPVPTTDEVVAIMAELTDPDIPAVNKTDIVIPGFTPEEAGTIDNHLNRSRRQLPLNFVVTDIQPAPSNLAGATLATVGNPRQSTYARPIVLVDQGGHWLITHDSAMTEVAAFWSAADRTIGGI